MALIETVASLPPTHQAAFALICVERLNTRRGLPMDPLEDLAMRSTWSLLLGETAQSGPVVVAIRQIENNSAKLPPSPARHLMVQAMRAIVANHPVTPIVEQLSVMAERGQLGLSTSYLETVAAEVLAVHEEHSDLNRQALLANVSTRVSN